MYPLRLSVNPQGWRHFIARKTDAAFQTFAQQVWQRDGWQCQYCGITQKTGQEVVNIDGDYIHNDISNLTTACALCTQCGFLESIGMDRYGGGALIYLPELTQEQLNGLCYALFKSISEADEQEESAQQYYQSLTRRAELVETHLGAGMSEPAVLGQLMVESELSPTPDTFIAHLRLLPSRVIFKEYIMDWIAQQSNTE
jgi:intracellular multiplication protein IcmJ